MIEFLTKCNTPTVGSRTNQCIVLDLDETLLHTFDHITKEEANTIIMNPEYIRIRDRFYLIDVSDPFTRKGEGHHIYMWGLLRPHIKEFLEFCFSHFKVVAVWTAGTKPYAKEIVTILSRYGAEPKIVYSRNDCADETGHCSSKDLNKMIQECNVTMDISNTFIVDDRLDNFLPNPDNGILIPTYQVSPNKESMLRDDNALLKLMDWFQKSEVMKSKDVRTLNKDNIFS